MMKEVELSQHTFDMHQCAHHQRESLVAKQDTKHRTLQNYSVNHKVKQI